MGTPSTYNNKPNRRPRYAITNPVYLHPAGQTFNRPATTRLRLRLRGDSPFIGGTLRLESATGERLDEHQARAGTLDMNVPASARWTLVQPNGQSRTEYLINANTQLLDLQRYLYRGRFLRDFPSAKSGEVPVEAWRLNEHAEAMRELTVER